MRQRPIGPLLDGLGQLGVAARAEFANDCPPVIVETNGLPGGVARVRGDISSQYISALLLAGPYAASGLELQIQGELVSAPYIDMTIGIMADFGVQVQRISERCFRIQPGQRYQGRIYDVEPDASNASYFFAAAAVTGGRVRVPHLGQGSAQGDLGLLEVLERMGCTVLRESDGIEVRGPDHSERWKRTSPGWVTWPPRWPRSPPLLIGPVTIRGIAQTHYEECDRRSRRRLSCAAWAYASTASGTRW